MKTLQNYVRVLKLGTGGRITVIISSKLSFHYRICMMASDNKCNLVTRDDDCPNDEGFEYGVRGKV